MSDIKIRKKACIIINNEQKGFFIAIAKLLEGSYNYDVTIICKDRYVKKLVDELLPGRSGDIIFSDIKDVHNESNIIDTALHLEKKYKFTMSQIISEDRALGQGYLSNVQMVPNIIRASWPHSKKILSIVNLINKYEVALNGCDLILQQWPNKIVTTVAKKNNARSFSLANIKFENRFFWTNDNYISGKKYIDRVKENIKNPSIEFEKIKDYVIEKDGDMINRSVDFTYYNAIKRAAFIILNDTKNWIRGINKKNSYLYLGWVPSVFRRVRNYKFVKSIGVKPEQLSDYKIIFHPLQMEPEISLLYYSPEFTNSMEAIIWLSKSVPSDVIIVVKEQVKSFSVRSRWYYKQLHKIPNVVLADPDIHSWKWISSSEAVSSITGTVAVEGVHMMKPVISFGRHQIVNFLPTVFYVQSYDDVAKAVKKIFSKIDKYKYVISTNSLRKAQIDTSFEFPNYKFKFKSTNLELDLAHEALIELDKEHNI